MRKQVGFLLCVAALAFMLCGLTYDYEYIYVSGDYSYALNERWEAQIVAYSGSSEEVTFPTVLDEHPVVSIGAVMKGNTVIPGFESLKRVNIPEGVTSIGQAAFLGCDLEAVSLPESLVSIGNGAFHSCVKLTEIDLPQNLKEIDSMAFYCTRLKEITIPEGVEELRSSVFSNCVSLTKVTLPEKLRSIGNEAFFGCIQLTKIRIPAGIETIGRSAFAYCEALPTPVVPPTAAVGEDAFMGCAESNGVTYLTGSTVTLGCYSTYNFERQRESPLEWKVIAEEEDGLILICKSVVANEPYYQIPALRYGTTEERFLEVVGYADWEHSFPRDFLNHEFIMTAFTAEERAHLLPMNYTDNGREFTDYAFIPSAEELRRWLPDASDRSFEQGWDLRGYTFQNGTDHVERDGSIVGGSAGMAPSVYTIGMRPVIKVDYDVFAEMNQPLHGTLMEYTGKEDTFRTGTAREQIHSITFRDTLADAPAGSVDASQAGDGSVLAWLTPAENELFDLTIAAESGVRFPINSTRLLGDFTNAVSIDFGNGVDTSRVHWMGELFELDMAVQELDLRCFNTGEVCDMHRMFENCRAMTKLDVSSFDTSHVSNTVNMFCYCIAAQTLDLSNFTTDYLSKMDGMFEGCDELTQLDISGFDTSRVRSMNWVFIGSNKLLSVTMKNFSTISTWGSDTFSLVELKINDKIYWDWFPVFEP